MGQVWCEFPFHIEVCFMQKSIRTLQFILLKSTGIISQSCCPVVSLIKQRCKDRLQGVAVGKMPIGRHISLHAQSRIQDQISPGANGECHGCLAAGSSFVCLQLFLCPGHRDCLGPKLQVAENASEARISVYIAEGCSKPRRLSQSYDLTVP